MSSNQHPFKPKPEYWSILTHSVITFAGQSSMQVVDLLFCRGLGGKASATVGTASSLFAWFLILGIGLMSSLEYFIPHSLGEEDHHKAHSYFYSGVGVALLIGVLSTIGLVILSSLSASLGFNSEIAPLVKSFGSITAFGYIAVFLAPVLRIELQTRGHPSDSTFAFVFGNILNVFLNWVFVFGHLGVPAMGVMGCAWSNILSRYGIMFFLLARVYFVRSALPLYVKFKEVHFLQCAKKIIAMGAPISLHMLFEMGAFVMVSTLAARLIPSQNAAHAIVLSLAGFTFMVPLGISSAATLTMSKAVGEKNEWEAAQLGKMSIRLGLIYAFLASTLYVVAKNQILELYTTDQETIRIGSRLLVVVAIFQFGDALQVILSGCLRGFGETKIQAKMNAFGHWVIGIPLGVFLCFYLKLEILGLWIGLCVGLWTVGCGLLFWWRKSTLHHGIQTF